MLCTTVGLTVEEITGNAILFLLAGYDTTASTMTFMTYSLATNPECQDRLIEEIDSVLGVCLRQSMLIVLILIGHFKWRKFVSFILQELPTYDNIQKLEYLDMVFCETLRLYPPATRFVKPRLHGPLYMYIYIHEYKLFLT